MGLYLQEKVPQHRNQNPQYGKIKDYELTRGDFIFVLKSSSPPLTSYDGFREERKRVEAEKKRYDTAKLPSKPEQPPSVSTDLKDGDIARDGRFIAYANGTVLDTKTNLMWAERNDGKGLTWDDAWDYCKNYRAGGYTDWRMPTIDELETIYDPEMENLHGYHSTKLIDITGEWVWALEGWWGSSGGLNFNSGSPCLALIQGNWHWASRLPPLRALPVRAGS